MNQIWQHDDRHYVITQVTSQVSKANQSKIIHRWTQQSTTVCSAMQ